MDYKSHSQILTSSTKVLMQQLPLWLGLESESEL